MRHEGESGSGQGAYKYFKYIVELWLKGTDTVWYRVQTTTLRELREHARGAMDSKS